MLKFTHVKKWSATCVPPPRECPLRRQFPGGHDSSGRPRKSLRLPGKLAGLQGKDTDSALSGALAVCGEWEVGQCVLAAGLGESGGCVNQSSK